jgi:hypothetical protein
MIDQKQLKNVEYFNYLGRKITNYARSKCEIKSSIVMAKATFKKKKREEEEEEEDTFHQQIGLNFKEDTSEVLHLEHSFVRC